MSLRQCAIELVQTDEGTDVAALDPNKIGVVDRGSVDNAVAVDKNCSGAVTANVDRGAERIALYDKKSSNRIVDRCDRHGGSPFKKLRRTLHAGLNVAG